MQVGSQRHVACGVWHVAVVWRGEVYGTRGLDVDRRLRLPARNVQHKSFVIIGLWGEIYCSIIQCALSLYLSTSLALSVSILLTVLCCSAYRCKFSAKIAEITQDELIKLKILRNNNPQINGKLVKRQWKRGGGGGRDWKERKGKERKVFARVFAPI